MVQQAKLSYASTYVAAKQVVKWVTEDGSARIAIVGRNAGHVREVMLRDVDRAAGSHGPPMGPWLMESRVMAKMPSGAELHFICADNPDRARGMQFSKAWAHGLREDDHVLDVVKMALRSDDAEIVLSECTPRMHQSVVEILEHFEYGHLPQPLADVSAPFCDLARRVAVTLEGPEATVALRKLLEAKDAAVRAKVVAMRRQETPPP